MSSIDAIPTPIVEFLNQNRIATLSYNDGICPACFICFFAFDAENARLIFKSTRGAAHDAVSTNGTVFAGTVLPDTFDALKLKGLQFLGHTVPLDKAERAASESLYYRKYGFARVMPGYIWAIDVQGFKLSSTTAGLRRKSSWNRREVVKQM